MPHSLIHPKREREKSWAGEHLLRVACLLLIAFLGEESNKLRADPSSDVRSNFEPREKLFVHRRRVAPPSNVTHSSLKSVCRRDSTSEEIILVSAAQNVIMATLSMQNNLSELDAMLMDLSKSKYAGGSDYGHTSSAISGFGDYSDYLDGPISIASGSHPAPDRPPPPSSYTPDSAVAYNKKKSKKKPVVNSTTNTLR